MTPHRTGTRDRMLESASALMREKGAAATSLDDVLRHSGTPRGSIYHHFPGGRAQLVAEVVGQAGDAVTDLLCALDEDSAVATFDAFVAAWRANLVASDFRAGCPILAVAIETDDEAPQLTDAAARAFASWRAALQDRLRRDGATTVQARRLATLVVAAIEGAVVLCRLERSAQPLDDVARELRGRLADQATPRRRRAGGRRPAAR